MIEEQLAAARHEVHVRIGAMREKPSRVGAISGYRRSSEIAPARIAPFARERELDVAKPRRLRWMRMRSIEGRPRGRIAGAKGLEQRFASFLRCSAERRRPNAR